MEDLSLWMLITAGGAIGLLGVFLSASERELKKTRREVEAMVAQLEAAPKMITLDDPVEPQPMDVVAPTGLTAQDQDLSDKIASLTSDLEASRRTVEELRRERDRLQLSEAEFFDLRASHQQLQAEIVHLKEQLQAGESRAGAAADAADDRQKLHSEIADLKSQLETSQAKGRELEIARQRLAEFESRQTFDKEQQLKLEAQYATAQQELAAAKETLDAVGAAGDRVAELERLYQGAQEENRRLEQEMIAWRERLAGADQQRRRYAMMRQQLDELQSKHGSLLEGQRRFQEDLAGALRLLELSTDGGAGPDMIVSKNGDDGQADADSGYADASVEIAVAQGGMNPPGVTSIGKRRRRFGIFSPR